MSIQLTRHSLKWDLQSIARMMCVLGTASLMLLFADYAMAKSKSKKDTPVEVKEYVWPASPSEPVIKYAREFRSDKMFKVKKKSRWKDVLLGEENEQLNSLATPYGVHADSQGRVLVTDLNRSSLAVFDFEKKTFSSMGSKKSGNLTQPIAIATDHFGQVYVTDGRGQKVAVYDVNGNFMNNLGDNDEFEKPIGIVVDNQRERVYVADMLKHHIVVFNLKGERVTTIGERGIEPGQFNFPLNIALDTTGRLLVVDSMNFRIQIIDPDSEEIITFGEQGGGYGQFARPKGIAVDSDDNIYVSDAAFNNVQIFNRDGVVLMAFGQGGNGPGEFNLPAGLSIDAKDNVYVADQANGRIQVFQYLGKPELVESDDSQAD